MTPDKKSRKRFTGGVQERFRTGCGNIYVFVGLQEDMNPFEVFVTVGKPGACGEALGGAIGRLSSLALRYGIPPEQVVEQLEGIQCHKPSWENQKLNMSCADCVAKALKRVIELRDRLGNVEIQIKENPPQQDRPKRKRRVAQVKTSQHLPMEVDQQTAVGICPNCNTPLVKGGGCAKCPNCQYEDCG